MLEEANRLGFPLGRRAFYDWVEWGLLGEPTYRGMGRGDQSLWSPQQHELFLALLNARREAKRIVALCNIPVWWWLRRGDTYAAIPQVRRALRTWGRAITSHSPATARKAAQQLLREVQYPEYPRIRFGGRREFVSGVAQMIADKRIDQQALTELITPVFDRESKGTPRGPEGIQLSPGVVAEMIAARYEGIQHLAELTDSAFETARTIYLASRGFVSVNESTLSSDPNLRNFHFAFDQNFEASTACHNLTALLGVLYRMGRQAQSAEKSLLSAKSPQWVEQMFALMMELGKVSPTPANAQRVIQQLYRIVNTAKDVPAGERDQARRLVRGLHSLSRAPRKKQVEKFKALGRVILANPTHPEALLEAMKILES